MTAIPMRFEDALRFNGYAIEQYDAAAFEIVVATGTISVPRLRLSRLVWKRPPEADWLGGHVEPNAPEPRDSFYLADLPVFHDDYRPVLLSHILDRYSTRRIGYDTPDQFGLALRRWMNLHTGAFSVIARMYLSTAVDLPLTTDDAAVDTTGTDRGRVSLSDFPQTQLSGDVDYASTATDRSSAQTGSEHRTGRSGRSVMELLSEQRAAYLNADELYLDSMDGLFLGVWDDDEWDSSLNPAPSGLGFLPGRW